MIEKETREEMELSLTQKLKQLLNTIDGRENEHLIDNLHKYSQVYSRLFDILTSDYKSLRLKKTASWVLINLCCVPPCLANQL